MSKPTYEELKKRVKELEKAEAERQQIDVAQKESAQTFDLILNSAPDIIYRLDSQGKIVFINKALSSLGYTQEELMGTSILKIVHPDDREQSAHRINERRTGDRSTKRYELRLLRKDKDAVPFEDKSIGVDEPVFLVDAEGFYETVTEDAKNFLGTLGVARDITERKKTEEALKESERQLRFLYESMTKGVCQHEIVYDDSGTAIDYRILGVNPHYETILGLNREDVIGKLATEIYQTDEAPFLETYAKVAETNEPARLEEYFEPMDKHFSILVFSPEKGKFATVFENITNRKKAEEALLLNSEMIKNMTEGVYLVGIDDEIIKYTNPKFEEMFGYNSGEMIGKHASMVVAPADKDPKERAKEIMKVIRETGEWHGEVNNMRKDGTPFWCYANVSVFDHPVHGSVLMAVHADITERKEAEEALKESEELYRTLIDTLPQNIYLLDSKLRYVSANEAYCNTYDFKLKDIIGKTSLDVFSEKLAIDYMKGDRKIFKTGKPQHYIERSIIKNKEEVWFEIVKTPVKDTEGNVAGVLGIYWDISDRKKAEEALKENEEKYRTLVEINPHVIYQLDTNGIITFISQRINKITGYKADELIGKNISEIVYKGDLDKIEMLNEKRTGDRAVRRLELRIIGKRGIKYTETRFIGVNATGVYENGYIGDGKKESRGKASKFIGTHGTITDITERKKAEKILRESESRFRELFDNMNSGVAIYEAVDNGLDFIIKDINGAGERISEVRKDAIYGKSIQEVFPGVEEFGLLDVLKSVWETGEMMYHPVSLYKDNRLLQWVENYVYKLPSAELVAVYDDVTEEKKAGMQRKALEEQLFQAQKMESIGRLAGGIAHDFNNILTGVMGYAELLKLKQKGTTQLEEEATDAILKGVKKAADLTWQLLGFARGGKYNPIPVNINDVIEETIKVSEKVFEKNVKVKYYLKENIDTIEADETQLEQVLTNIIINAKDAMPKGGELSFKTENVFIDENYSDKNLEFKSGDYVKISITDTGVGIPEDIKENIFEPFFTTKGVGKGTGLGLATVYGILKNHNGYIYCDSKQGEGTTFTIYLPASEKKIIKKKKERRKIITGHQTIFVIDDEEGVRILVEKQLESLGYKVVLAKDGLEAVEIYKEKKDEIDLVLLDMIMPDMAGREIFFALKKINAEVKVLIISGFSQDERASEILNDGALGFLKKPISLQELSKMISDVFKV